MTAARPSVARHQHAFVPRADHIRILTRSRRGDGREVTPCAVGIFRRHAKTRVARVKVADLGGELIVLDEGSQRIGRAHRRAVLRRGQHGPVGKRGAQGDAPHAIARTHARDRAASVGVGVAIRPVHGKSVERETDDRRVVLRINRSNAGRKLVRVIHAARPNMRLAGVERRRLPEHRVAVPDVEIVVTHRIERIEERHTVDQRTNDAQRRCSWCGRNGRGLGDPEHKALIHRRVWITCPRTDRVRRDARRRWIHEASGMPNERDIGDDAAVASLSANIARP